MSRTLLFLLVLIFGLLLVNCIVYFFGINGPLKGWKAALMLSFLAISSFAVFFVYLRLKSGRKSN